jgi:hypothetical protein
MGRSRFRWWLAVPLLVLLGACGGRAVEATDAAPPADAGGDRNPDDCDANGLCFADFPCRGSAGGAGGSICASATAMQQCVVVPCEVACQTRCCSGASCGFGAITPCDPGLVCFEAHSDAGYTVGPAAACRPPRDAGADASYAGWVEGTGDSYCY